MNAFAALADSTRREILLMLAQHGELAASDISDRFQMSAPAISQHLKVLREAKVIQMKKQAQRRLYSIDRDGLDEVGAWLEQLKELWNKRLDALEYYFQDSDEKEL